MVWKRLYEHLWCVCVIVCVHFCVRMCVREYCVCGVLLACVRACISCV